MPKRAPTQDADFVKSHADRLVASPLTKFCHFERLKPEKKLAENFSRDESAVPSPFKNKAERERNFDVK